MSARSPIEPYRLLFPLGLAYGVIGAGVWVAAAVNWLPYPATLHRMLMIEGFEMCFIVGFLLTALPGLTHSRPATGAEVGTAFVALMLFGVCALANWTVGVHLSALVALVAVMITALRRLPGASQPPPEEFVHVGLGMVLGVTGIALSLRESFGAEPFGPPQFAYRLMSVGMVLTLVLGVGSLLVPTFIGMRDPLEIPGLAKAHERKPRRMFHAVIAAMLLGAFALEFASAPLWGSRLRAAAATIVLLLAWKIYRGAGRGDRSAWSMWGAGVFLLIGLWVAALGPRWTIAGFHIAFIGGFGLLTLAIATRVIVAHGKYGLPAEPKVLSPAVVVFVLIALLARIVGELRPQTSMHWYGLSGAAWMVACAWWFRAAWPRIRRIATPLIPPPA